MISTRSLHHPNSSRLGWCLILGIFGETPCRTSASLIVGEEGSGSTSKSKPAHDLGDKCPEKVVYVYIYIFVYLLFNMIQPAKASHNGQNMSKHLSPEPWAPTPRLQPKCNRPRLALLHFQKATSSAVRLCSPNLPCQSWNGCWNSCWNVLEHVGTRWNMGIYGDGKV